MTTGTYHSSHPFDSLKIQRFVKGLLNSLSDTIRQHVHVNILQLRIDVVKARVHMVNFVLNILAVLLYALQTLFYLLYTRHKVSQDYVGAFHSVLDTVKTRVDTRHEGVNARGVRWAHGRMIRMIGCH